MANDFEHLRRKANSARVQALLADVQAGFTFATIALQCDDGSDRRLRNQANARKAYDAIMTTHRKLTFTPTEEHELNDGLGKLKSALRKLGESF